MSDPALSGGIVSDPILGGNVSDPALAGALYGGQGPAGPAYVPQTYPIAISARGQTSIPMPTPPSFPSSVRLTVNGLAYAPPDFVVGPTMVTWTAPDFILEPGDAVTLSYV